MRQPAFTLLITLVLCFSVMPQTTKTKRPELPANISAMAGQDSDTFLNDPAIKTRIKKLLGNKYASFMESFETLNPITKKENFLFSSGCLIHACTHLESAIAIDLINQTIHVAIFREDEKDRYFNEDGKATPEVIRNWASNLRQVNCCGCDLRRPLQISRRFVRITPI